MRAYAWALARCREQGLLSEILDFVMGKGLIPADGEVWKVRRRAIVPAHSPDGVEGMSVQRVATLTEALSAAGLTGP